MNQRGLTLVEVLVALGIFAAVSAIGVGALGLAAGGSRQLEEASARIGELERMRGLVRQDLYQVVQRPVRDADREAPRPPFVGGEALDDLLRNEAMTPLLTLVRSGWANPGDREPRAELQVVTYLAEPGSGRLVRRTRPFLDAVRDTPSRDETLLGGLGEVEIAFLQNGQWRPEAGRGPADELPLAVRFRFEHPAYGPMEHVFPVGGAR